MLAEKQEETDRLIRGTAAQDSFRFFIVRSTTAVRTAIDMHKLAPAPALLLGRLLTGALLVGAELKDRCHSITVKVEGNGPLGGALAVYAPQGKVKGYARQPEFVAPEPKDNWQIGKLLGQGSLTVCKDLKLKHPVSGTIKLSTGEIAEDLAQFYLQSEQVPTAVSLGVLFDPEGPVRSSGGYLIQQLPDADSSAAEKLMDNLHNTPYLNDLFDMGMTMPDILDRFIFAGMSWQQHAAYPVSYQCNCSKQRFAKALLTLGRAELSTLTDGISPVCLYCNKTYCFSSTDLLKLLGQLP